MSSKEEILDFASAAESNNSIVEKIQDDLTQTTTSTTYASSTKGASDAGVKQRTEKKLDIAEYLELVRKLRSRENRSRERRFRSAQVRKQNLFTVDEPDVQPQGALRQRRFDAMITVVGPRQSRQPVKPTKAAITTERTLAKARISTESARPIQFSSSASSTDTLLFSTSTNALRSLGEEVMLRSSSSNALPRKLSNRRSDNQHRTNSDVSFQLPEPLDSSAQTYSKVVKQLQPAGSQPAPSLPSVLTLSPLQSLGLRESVLALVFDPAGRRLISVEPSRGIRFRSVASNGGDMNPTESGLLDWRIWARAVCVLPGGHLLVATPTNLQLFKADGTCEAVSDRMPGIVGLAVFERSALALESWTDKLYVFELPKLQHRKYHPLYALQLQGDLKPIAMCAVRSLLVVANLNDTMRTFDIETGRLRQEVLLSSRKGPKALASCANLGLLFVSVFCDHRIHIFRLNVGILEKAGSLKDPGLKPGPIAWMPGNGVLFCATSKVPDARNCELRSYALHSADNWKPQNLLPVAI